MKLNAIIGLLLFSFPVGLFASDKQVSLRFNQPLSPFEQCLLNTLVEQTPFAVKHIEVAGPLAFGNNKRRVELPVLLVTDSNHPALVTLNLVSTLENEWGKITTGGWPIFVTPELESTINVHDTATREKAYSVTHNCTEALQ